jgi:hypothetical protein
MGFTFGEWIKADKNEADYMEWLMSFNAVNNRLLVKCLRSFGLGVLLALIAVLLVEY